MKIGLFIINYYIYAFHDMLNSVGFILLAANKYSNTETFQYLFLRYKKVATKEKIISLSYKQDHTISNDRIGKSFSCMRFLKYLYSFFTFTSFSQIE